MELVIVSAVAEKAFFGGVGRKTRKKGLDREDHAVHEFKLFVLRDTGIFVPHPLLVVKAVAISIKNVEVVNRHNFY